MVGLGCASRGGHPRAGTPGTPFPVPRSPVREGPPGPLRPLRARPAWGPAGMGAVPLAAGPRPAAASGAVGVARTARGCPWSRGRWEPAGGCGGGGAAQGRGSSLRGGWPPRAPQAGPGLAIPGLQELLPRAEGAGELEEPSRRCQVLASQISDLPVNNNPPGCPEGPRGGRVRRKVW